MPNWNEILDEIRRHGSTFDLIRRKYLANLHEVTGRNVICYYSGWLQKPGIIEAMIDDNDKNGLMTTINKMDRSKGLDIVLHTPGGETAAVESIVDYLRSCFGTDMRAIVPLMAMSGGTMIACACKSIVMGNQSSLGPVDPQFRGVPAHGILEEFKDAHDAIKHDPSTIPVWQPIIAKYTPTLVGECQKSVDWAKELVRGWLETGMFKDDPDPSIKVEQIVEGLTDHAWTKSHSRHLSIKTCSEELGLTVEELEKDDKLQDAVLSLHHAYMHTLARTSTIKIIENHLGAAFVIAIAQ